MTDSKIGVISAGATRSGEIFGSMLKDLSAAVEMTIYLNLSPNSFGLLVMMG